MASRNLSFGFDRRTVRATLVRSGYALLAKCDAIVAFRLPSQKWLKTIELALKHAYAAQRHAKLESKHADSVEKAAAPALRRSLGSRLESKGLHTRAADSSNSILGLPHQASPALSVNRGVRVLVVDDHERWRAVVRTVLKREATVIDEAGDGQRAVELAKQLQPDVVLLDIEMPLMNGFEAALGIAHDAPQTKIIFLSMTRDPAVIEHALGTGAWGYVLKTDAAKELVPAIVAAVDNRRFVSTAAARVLRSLSPAQRSLSPAPQ